MKRFIAVASVLALCFVLAGCGGGAVQASSGQSSAESAQGQQVKKPIDYSTGTHHAEIRIEGYNTPIELEIYSDSAPESSKKFCELVNKGYYNGKTINWILNGLYVRMGALKQDNRNLVTGEYEESDTENTNSLRTGWVALARAGDGQQSDASSLIFFLSDASYLDGKYAGFAKVTDGLDVLNSIAARTADNAPADQRITVRKSGEIAKASQRPKIKSIQMVDEDDDNGGN